MSLPPLYHNNDCISALKLWLNIKFVTYTCIHRVYSGAQSKAKCFLIEFTHKKISRKATTLISSFQVFEYHTILTWTPIDPYALCHWTRPIAVKQNLEHVKQASQKRTNSPNLCAVFQKVLAMLKHAFTLSTRQTAQILHIRLTLPETKRSTDFPPSQCSL